MSELVNGFDASIVDQKASQAGPAGIRHCLPAPREFRCTP